MWWRVSRATSHQVRGRFKQRIWLCDFILVLTQQGQKLHGSIRLGWHYSWLHNLFVICYLVVFNFLDIGWVVCIFGHRMTDANYMSPHNALSWGYFDFELNKWQETLTPDVFPAYLLPKIANSGEVVSKSARVCGTSRVLDSSVRVALGDLQCSVYSCLETETDCGKLDLIWHALLGGKLSF